MASLPIPPFLGPASIVGVEHEYAVHLGGRPVDFRRIIHDVAATDPRVRLEPAQGYRLPEGSLLSTDGWYAEVATPPESLDERAPTRLANGAFDAQERLRRLVERYARGLGLEFELTGYSTHLSAHTTPARPARSFARPAARAAGPLFLALMARPESNGILVRPRPRRLEIAGDYVEEPDVLRAALTLLVATVLSFQERPLPSDALAEIDDGVLRPSRIRSGVRVSPRALVARTAADPPPRRPLRRSSRLRVSTETAGADRLDAFLMRNWDRFRPFAMARLAQSEVALVDDYVDGKRTTVLDLIDVLPEPVVRPRRLTRRRSGGQRTFTGALAPREVGRFRLEPVRAAWRFVTYRASGPEGDGFVNVPLSGLRAFNEGALDGPIAQRLDQLVSEPPRVLNLARPGETDLLGVFSGLRSQRPARGSGSRPSDSRGETRTSIDGNPLRGSTDVPTASRKKPPEREKEICTVRTRDGAIEIAVPRTADPQVPVGPQEPPQNAGTLARDVWAHNGSFHHTNSDLEVRALGSHFSFARSYRSALVYDGVLGKNWDHIYNIRVVPTRPDESDPIDGGWCERFDPEGKSGDLTYYHGTGRVTRHRFRAWEVREVQWCSARFRAVVTTYAQNPGDSFEIQRYAVTEGALPEGITRPVFYRITISGGTRLLLNCHGHIVASRDRNFNTMRFGYGLPFNPTTGFFVLKTITDALGRTYTLDYRIIDNIPRIVKLTDPFGRVVSYAYDDAVQLQEVALARGAAGVPRLKYGYAAGAAPGRLVTLTHPVEAAKRKGVPFLVNTYDGEGRVTRQRLGAAQGTVPRVGGTYVIAYPDAFTRIVTDRAGTRWTHRLSRLGSTKVVTRTEVVDEVFDGKRIVPRKRLPTTHGYDSNYHLEAVEYPSGRKEAWVYRNRNAPILLGATPRGDQELDDLEKGIVLHNDLGRDALLRHDVVPLGKAKAFETAYGYEWRFTSLTRIDSPYGRTSYDYLGFSCARPENNGNHVRVTHPPQLQPDGTKIPVVEEHAYGRGGSPTYYKDADGVEHRYGLDARGWRVSHTVAGEHHETLKYDTRGNVVRRTDDRKNRSTHVYDARDNPTSITDALGHVRVLTYDLNDRLVEEEAPHEDDPTSLKVKSVPKRTLRIRSSYDLLGNKTQLTQVSQVVGSPRRGRIQRAWRWIFDGEDRVVEAQSPKAVADAKSDARVRHRYNARGLTTQVISAAGGPDAGVARKVYDEDGRVAVRIDEVGRRLTTEFDAHGRVAKVLHPNGTTVFREYEGPHLKREYAVGDIPTGPESLGGKVLRRILRESTYKFDSHRKLIRRSDKRFTPESRETIEPAVRAEVRHDTFFTAAGRLAKSVAPSGFVTTYAQDAQGRLESMTMPAGHSVKYTYEGSLPVRRVTRSLPDQVPNRTAPTAPSVQEEVWVYDPLGRVTRETRIDGVTVQTAYDSLGNRRATVGPLGQTTFEYDGFSRVSLQTTDQVTSTANPDGEARTTYFHDPNDNIVGMQDDLRRRTICRYDGRDQRIFIDEPEVAPIQYGRRKDGSVDFVIRGAAGRRIQYGYDQIGSVTSIAYQDGASRSMQRFGYDGIGNLRWCLDSNDSKKNERVQVFRTYDSLQRLLSERTSVPEFQHDKVVRYSYAANQRSRQIIYPGKHSSIDYVFGSDGNVKEIREGRTPLIRRWHQGMGRLLEAERRLFLNVNKPKKRRVELRLRESIRLDSRGRPNRRALQLTDEVNRPTPVGKPQALANLVPFGGLEQLDYGTHGLPSRREFTSYVSAPGKFETQFTDFTYDGVARLRTTREVSGDRQRLREYERDGANRLHQLVETRVRKQVKDTSATRSVRYRPGSRTRTDTIQDRDIVSQLDVHGRTAKTTQFLRKLGVLRTRSLERTFQYDAADRLKSVAVRDFGVGAENGDVAFLYDALNRRVARVGGDADDAFGKRPRLTFVFDGPRVLLEYDERDQEQRKYVYDESGQITGYRFRDSASGALKDVLPVPLADGTPWFLFERQVSLNELPPALPRGASLRQRLDYLRARLPITIEQNVFRPFESPRILGFTYDDDDVETDDLVRSALPQIAGKREQPLERLHYQRRRFYDPDLQAFITPDPLGAWGDPKALGNTFTYGANNPVLFRDDGNAATFLLYVGTAALVALLATGVERATHDAFAEDREFDADAAFVRNFIIGLLPFGPVGWVGKAGGVIANRAALRTGAGLLTSLLAYDAGRYIAGTVATSALEYGVENFTPLGRSASFTEILLGNLVGDVAGLALEPLWRRGARRLTGCVGLNCQVGREVRVGGLQGYLLLTGAAREGLENEYGLFVKRDRSLVFRRGSTDSVPLQFVDTAYHIAHYHPPGGPWLRHRLPAPRDIQFADDYNLGQFIVSRRRASDPTVVTTRYEQRLPTNLTSAPNQMDVPVRLRPDRIDQLHLFTDLVQNQGLGVRQGEELLFDSLTAYEVAFRRAASL